MMQWESDNNYGQNALVKGVNGSVHGHVSPHRDNKSKYQYAYHARVSVVTEKELEFPSMEQDGFTSFQEAREWAEKWIAFFAEFLELRRMNPILRQQNHEQFTEIMHLRDELHDYRYPKAKE